MKVEIAFAAVPTDLNPVWTVVTNTVGRAIGANIRRGRRANEGNSQPGTAEVRIDDRDRKLDPTNPASPYAADLVPMRPMRISQQLADASWEIIWTGVVDSYRTDWAVGASVTTVAGADVLAWVASQRLTRSTYPATVLADAPMVWYRLREPTGAARVLDSSGNGRHSGFKAAGIETGSFKSTLPGAVVGSPDGACDLATTGNIPLAAGATPAGTGAISVEMFLRHEGEAPGVDVELMSLYGKGDTGSTTNAYLKLFIALNGAWQVNRYDSTNNLWTAVSTSSKVFDGQWHHCVWTRDGANFHRLYVDGVLAGSGTLGYVNLITGVLAVSLLKGAYMADELAVYNTTLSAARVTAHFTEARGKWGLPTVQRTGTRVGLVCDLVGWPAAKRSIAAGVEDMMGPEVAVASDVENSSAATHLAAASDVEGGRLFVSRDGVLTFSERRLTMPATVAAYRNDGAGLRFVHGLPARDRADLVNHAEVVRPGGAVAVAESATSVARYLRHDAPARTGWYGDDQDSAAAATRIVAAGKDVRTRLDQLTVDARIGAEEEAACARRELGDVVAVRLAPPGGSPIDLVCAVEGIAHVLDTGRQWRVTYDLSLVAITQTPAAAVFFAPDIVIASGAYFPPAMFYEWWDAANLHTARITPQSLTVPVPGDWLVTMTVAYTGTTAGSFVAGVVVAGATHGMGAGSHGAGRETTWSASTVLRLAAGDAIQGYVLQTSGAAVTMRYYPAYSPTLSAVLVS